MENTFAVVIMTTVSALGVIHRTRQSAFTALESSEQVATDSRQDAQQLVARLASELNQMQLDLSFGVECYIDSVLIPQLPSERYQSSLRASVGLNEGLGNTSQMLNRLQAVIETRLSALEAAEREWSERRRRVFSAVVAIGSLMALPPALLLAFFGVNGSEVSERRSIFDLSYYWPAYVLAWLPFIALVLVGFLLTRRKMRDADNQQGRNEAP